jgi:hypothetical protein
MVLARTRRINRPYAAERYQAAITHDYIDALWDMFRRPDRKRVAECVRQLILEPAVLREWAGVDVVSGLVRRTYGPEERFLFPVDTWEPESNLPSAYERLRDYITNRPIDALI